MAAVLRGGPCSLDVLSQVASESLGRESTSSSSTMEWHEHVHRLAELLDERGGKAAGAAAGHLDAGASAVVRQTLSAALHSAKADANWSSRWGAVLLKECGDELLCCGCTKSIPVLKVLVHVLWAGLNVLL